MPMQDTFLPESRLGEFLAKLTDDYRVMAFTEDYLAPFGTLSARDRAGLSLRGPRSPFPARAFFFPPREELARFSAAGTSAEPPEGETSRPFALVNLRPCDLAAIQLLDEVLLDGQFSDPTYQARRQSTLIVSTDCATPSPWCFCERVGGSPSCDGGPGIHLSPVQDGYLMQADTDLALRALEGLDGIAMPASASQGEERARTHAETLAALSRQNERFGPAGEPHAIFMENDDRARWHDLAADCVECGACTNVCPTCHCFYMFDRMDESECRRSRMWDSCLYGDYSRMAGLGSAKPSPRPGLASRYQNRFMHKFRYHYETHGVYSCTGCGRCSQTCLGSTDPRETMRVLQQ